MRRHIKRNWYGIAGMKFIWNGCWSDPTIIYKCKEINPTITESTMWDRYNEECNPPEDYKSNEYHKWEDKFSDYMFEKQDDVRELLDMLIEA